jgi:hypothetical protein
MGIETTKHSRVLSNQKIGFNRWTYPINMGSFYKFEKSTDFLHKLSNSISAISHNITILVVPTSTIHACALEVLSCMSHILVFMRKSDAILDCLKLLMWVIFSGIA